MTRIFDDPAAFADEAIAGFVAAHPDHVIRVDGGVVRAAASRPGQVAVVIGGGSGHYPAFAGLVGVGLAAGAVCGNVFASPGAGQVYRVARAAESSGGVLFSYGNYAGDVMQFGLAQERLRSEGIDTRTVVVTDDIASAPVERMDDRRGIAGDLTVFKIAGAAAESGFSLDEVEHLARKATSRTRTLGVAFRGCTLPGAAEPLFSLPAGQMSVGLGIHGEPGISDMPIPPASELAELLVGRLLAETPEHASDRAVVLVNGLGTVKYEELFLFYGKVAALLATAGVHIVGVECGELVTSLDMAGLSLTVFWVDDELEALWFVPVDTPAYHRGRVAPREVRRVIEVDRAPVQVGEVASPASRQLADSAVAVLDAVARVVRAHEQELGDLDAVAGDGDHGIGMRRGADAAAEAAHAALIRGAGVHELLIDAGEQWSERAGGTSGALWGSAARAVATSLGNRDVYRAQDLVDAAAMAREAVTRLGGAVPGDKTMVDAISPYVDTLSYHISRGTSVGEALKLAAEAATRAASDTAALRPRKGRARPLAERSLGTPDPGAVSFALIVTALAELADSWPSQIKPVSG